MLKMQPFPSPATGGFLPFGDMLKNMSDIIQNMSDIFQNTRHIFQAASHRRFHILLPMLKKRRFQRMLKLVAHTDINA